MGWEALEQWGDAVTRIEPLAGGVANDVWSAGFLRISIGQVLAHYDEEIGATGHAKRLASLR